MKEACDKDKMCTAVLTDLSKAFDCLKHVLLIDNVHALGFNYRSRSAIYAYRSKIVRVTKVSSFYRKNS